MWKDWFSFLGALLFLFISVSFLCLQITHSRLNYKDQMKLIPSIFFVANCFSFLIPFRFPPIHSIMKLKYGFGLQAMKCILKKITYFKKRKVKIKVTVPSIFDIPFDVFMYVYFTFLMVNNTLFQCTCIITTDGKKKICEQQANDINTVKIECGR